jgi:hypothetical protein
VGLWDASDAVMAALPQYRCAMEMIAPHCRSPRTTRHVVVASRKMRQISAQADDHSTTHM